MTKKSKRWQQARQQIDRTKAYEASEAIDLAIGSTQVKFDAGVEVHLRLGIDPKKADQIVRGSVVLPHGTGKKKKIAVFAEGKDQATAKQAGAVLVGGEELVAEIKKTGKCDFDVALATPEMMKKLGQIAKILGPKGLMPNPRNETVTKDLKKSITALGEGKVTFRNDDTSNIHQLIGKVSFGQQKLLENFDAFIAAIKAAKPSGVKGTYIKNIVVCSSMGPGIRVNF